MEDISLREVCMNHREVATGKQTAFQQMDLLLKFNSQVGLPLCCGGFSGRKNCVWGETLKKITCVLVELRITDLISLRKSRASDIEETVLELNHGKQIRLYEKMKEKDILVNEASTLAKALWQIGRLK